MLVMLIIIFISSLIILFFNLQGIKWFWLTVTILSAIVLITGIVSVENNPPHIGLVTRFNKKVWGRNKPVIIGEGLNWVFLKGIIHDIIPINVKLKQNKFEPQEIQTPDNVKEGVPISYAYNVDPEESHTYINVNQEAGVNESINKILEGRLREYSRHPTEGPMAWREMIASGIKTLDYLIKGFCESQTGREAVEGYDYVEKISDEIPTPILLDWYLKKNPPNGIVRKEWGDGEDKTDNKGNQIYEDNLIFEGRWKKLEDKLVVLAEKSNENVETFKQKLSEKIEKRINLLKKLQRNEAKIKVTSLGIYLTRLTIGDVKPFGDIYEADIHYEVEEKQRKSETYEVETDFAKAAKLQEKLNDLGQKEVTIDECYQIIMKYKMIAAGKGFVYDGQFGSFAGLSDLVSSVMKGGKK